MMEGLNSFGQCHRLNYMDHHTRKAEEVDSKNARHTTTITVVAP